MQNEYTAQLPSNTSSQVKAPNNRYSTGQENPNADDSFRLQTSILSQDEEGGVRPPVNNQYSDFSRASPSPIYKQNFSFKKSEPDIAETGEHGGGFPSNSKSTSDMIGQAADPNHLQEERKNVNSKRDHLTISSYKEETPFAPEYCQTFGGARPDAKEIEYVLANLNLDEK